MTVLVISAGRGPIECRWAVRKVVDQLMLEALEHGVDVDEVPGPNMGRNGPVSVRLLMNGADEFIAQLVRGWVGTVQVVARSERRSKADRKNWFIGVQQEVAPPSDVVSIAAADVEFQAITAGGPGGQHQNKTASAVRARHRTTGLSVVVRSERSQHRNKAEALRRLSSMASLMSVQDKVISDRKAWGSRIAVVRGDPIKILS